MLRFKFVFQTFHYLCYQDVKEVSQCYHGVFHCTGLSYSCNAKKVSFSSSLSGLDTNVNFLNLLYSSESYFPNSSAVS